MRKRKSARQRRGGGDNWHQFISKTSQRENETNAYLNLQFQPPHFSSPSPEGQPGQISLPSDSTISNLPWYQEIFPGHNGASYPSPSPPTFFFFPFTVRDLKRSFHCCDSHMDIHVLRSPPGWLPSATFNSVNCVKSASLSWDCYLLCLQDP